MASVSANGTVVTLTAPLQFNHLGARDSNGNLVALPDVNNLNRNVMFESQNPNGTRGYVTFTDHATVDVENAGFLNLGRTTDNQEDDTTFDSLGNVTHIGTNQDDRYAVHFDTVIGPGNTTSSYVFTFAGNMVGNNLGDPTEKWGIDVDSCSYGLIQNNVVFNMGGAGIVTESGSETYNTFDRQQRRARHVGNGSTSDGRQGSGSGSAGPDNYVTNNVTADIPDAFAFVYDMFLVGTVTVEAYPGDDIVTNPSSGLSVNMNLTPILSFANNESYGVTWSGLGYYWLGTGGVASTNTPTSTFTNYLAWNVTYYGVAPYAASNVTFNGLTIINSLAQSADTVGISFSDYYTNNFTLTNANIQGMEVGVSLPVDCTGVQTINNSFFQDVTDIVDASLWSVNYRSDGLQPRTTYLINDVFDTQPPVTAPSQAMTAISLEFSAGPCTNVVQTDQMFVENYNGVAGDNFQVYFAEQAANFIVPQTILNSDGTPAFSGAPVAGLTNAQTWSQYGVAIGGSVAPATAKSRAGIIGALVNPTS